MSKIMSKGLGLTLLVAAFLLGGCKPKEENNSLLKESKIHKVSTKQKLTELLKEGHTHRGITYASNTFWDVGIMEDFLDAPAATPETGSDNTPKRDYVSTNLQDNAVDESDIIKTDGNNVYYINEGSNKFTVFSVLEDHTIEKKREIVEKDSAFTEMYLLGDYIVIIGAKGVGVNMEYHYNYSYYSWGSAIFVYDIASLEKVYSLELNYSITTTRVIDRALYVVGHKNLHWQNENELPVKVENDEEETLGYEDIYYFDDTLSYGMTLIGGLYLDSDPEKISYEDEGYLGAAYGNKNIYVNENNLYLSDSTYYYGKTSAYTSLTISQFALSNADAKATYVGAGTLKGAALNQFAMDEYNGHLRIATTDSERKWNVNIVGEALAQTQTQMITNYLYILKMDKAEQTFELVGHISEGLGKPNETIRSVRFSGDKGYIVTFLQTDPLYVINLSDPKSPVITDAIVLPGFDTYQHPWSENSLIGLGYNATETGRTNGIKISAYDTTSGSASELQTLTIADYISTNSEYRYVNSEALNNHKAILVSPAHNIFGFPIYTYSQTYYDNFGNYQNISEYVLFKIDFTSKTPITELVRISHQNSGEYQQNIRRAILIEGFVYTFANGSVATYDIANNIVSDAILNF